MVASAFLPVALVNNQLFFLFGKETDDDSSPGFSDFGGGVEHGEDIYKAGLREMAEETTGFLGNAQDIERLVKKNGGVYPMKYDTYHTHIFRLDYDPKLVEYYNNNHKFVYEKMNNKYLRKTKIFEKIEIQWMSVDEIQKRKHEFRGFYQKIVDHILADVPKIKQFIISTKKTSKTKTRRNLYG
jgi:8-oxo-dGTP pyrophosphatase MutT (NUDIX family)